MPDPNDFTSNVEASESDVIALKKAHYQGGGGTRTAAPVQVQTRLNPQLVQMLTLGKTYNQFQGIDRCIRILEPGTPHQHHCMAMMVKNFSTNMLMCSSCDRVKDTNARPHTINSASVKLTQKELEEMKMQVDPLENAKPISTKKAKVSKEHQPAHTRRPKMAVPNSVKIEVTMKELQSNPNVVSVLLQKTLDAIFELPVKNFREAEEIRVVKERVEEFLSYQGESGIGDK